MRLVALFCSLLLISSLIIAQDSTKVVAQDSTKVEAPKKLSLLFVGDIMGHQSQINAAFNDNSGTYNYDSCFKYIAPELSKPDITIANLEVTLAGWPYAGYPQFSSPDALAGALKQAGVDIMVTANNHSCDRRQQGVERTIRALDSMNIQHTGTFLNAEQRAQTYPLLIEKNGFKIALLNYTYATNGIPATPPNIVNLIKKEIILADLEKAKLMEVDKTIVFMHWGTEYKLHPSDYQVKFYELCKNNGADIVIGSHPHVLQKMEWHQDEIGDGLVAYSLGNFISNQRTSPRDGGALIQIDLVKNDTATVIQNTGYYLTWVYPPKINNRKKFYVLPVSKFEQKSNFMGNYYFEKMKTYAGIARKLLQKENKDVNEFKFNSLTDEYEIEKP